MAEQKDGEALELDQPQSVPWLGGILAAVLTLASVAAAADLYRRAGLILFTEQRMLAMVGVALMVAYIVFPISKSIPRPHPPWYDWLAAAVAFAVCGYTAVDYERIFENLSDRPIDATVCSIIVILLVLEGLRRTAGNVLFLFLALFILFGLFGHYIPGQFQGRNVAVDRMAIYLALDTNGMVGVPMVVSTSIVIMFVFFGYLLEASGGSKFFTDISVALMGRYRGGASKIAIVASSLFGSVSGSAVSNVVSTGVVTIPLMRKGGYPAHVAGAIEAVASTGGQLMPPIMGAAAFVMAEFLQIPYSEVVIAAIIPAVLYYVTLFFLADLYAGRNGIKRVAEEFIPRRWPVFKKGWIYLVPFAVLIYALFGFNLRPDESALWGSIAVFIIGVAFGYGGERMPLQMLWTTIKRTGVAVVQIVMIGAMAGMVIGVLNITGLGFATTQALILFAAGNLFYLLVMAAIVSIILGMGMPTLGVYLLLATLVTPSLVELGIPPIAAHMFALYFGMLSMITPPVAIAAFAAATIAETDAMKTGFAAVQFGWAAYFIPFLFVLAPELLMEGDPLRVVLITCTAIAGIWLVSTGIIGFMVTRMDALARVAIVVAGVLLMLPSSRIPYARWSDVIGAVIAAVIIMLQYSEQRKKQTVPIN
jgi:TRAP transporter 4TM/12TM fusion protein